MFFRRIVETGTFERPDTCSPIIRIRKDFRRAWVFEVRESRPVRSILCPERARDECRAVAVLLYAGSRACRGRLLVGQHVGSGQLLPGRGIPGLLSLPAGRRQRFLFFDGGRLATAGLEGICLLRLFRRRDR